MVQKKGEMPIIHLPFFIHFFFFFSTSCPIYLRPSWLHCLPRLCLPFTSMEESSAYACPTRAASSSLCPTSHGEACRLHRTLLQSSSTPCSTSIVQRRSYVRWPECTGTRVKSKHKLTGCKFYLLCTTLVQTCAPPWVHAWCVHMPQAGQSWHAAGPSRMSRK
jgi:hypothetical protein